MLALRLNPLTYGVDGLRGALGHAFAFSVITDFAVLVIASSILLSIDSYLFSKIQL
jgi:ABC-2 type transport system permease protein